MTHGIFASQFPHRRGAVALSLAVVMVAGGLLSVGCAAGPRHRAYSSADLSPEPPDVERDLFGRGGLPDASTHAEQSTTTIPEGMRPGNPQQWGESAMRLVGRDFDPVYFEGHSAELDPLARRRLNEHAGWLDNHPGVWMTLIGHAGKGLTTEYAYNLGMARALAVQQFMREKGFDEQRFYPLSYGADWPRVDAQAQPATQLNDRVELLGFYAPSNAAGPPPQSARPGQAPVRDVGDSAPSARELIRGEAEFVP